MATSKTSTTVELTKEPRVTKGGWHIFSKEDDGVTPARNIYLRGTEYADAKSVKITIEKVS